MLLLLLLSITSIYATNHPSVKRSQYQELQACPNHTHMNMEAIRKVIREEISSAETNRTILQILTGTTFKDQIKDGSRKFLEKELPTRLSQLVPTQVQSLVPREVRNYLEEHLHSRVEREVQRVYRETTEPLIRLQVMQMVGGLSGVTELLQEHHNWVAAALKGHSGEFQNLAMMHRDQLQSLRAKEYLALESAIHSYGDQYVRELVASNGHIIKSFVNEMKSQVNAHFREHESRVNRILASKDQEIRYLRYALIATLCGLIGVSLVVLRLSRR